MHGRHEESEDDEHGSGGRDCDRADNARERSEKR